MHDYELNVKL